MQISCFNFCGCGDLLENLTYVYKGLLLIEFHLHSDISYINFETLQKQIFGSLKAAHFFFYWADKEKLTEHGSCMPGWVTEKGNQLLTDIYNLIGAIDGASNYS